VDEIQVGQRPGPVAYGDGLVWVGNLDERSLTKIDARERVSEGNEDLDEQTPTGIAVGADAVWVAHGVSGTLSRVDPEFGLDETRQVAGEALGSVNGSVAVEEGGAVWVVYGDSTLARIDPQSVQVTGTTIVPGSAPAGIAVEAGFLWIVSTDSATVDRYAPRTFEEGPLGPGTSVGRRPTAIAAGEDALWVANTGSNTVTRLDPGTPPSTEQTPVGDGPAAVAVGANAVWIANSGDGTVSRLDPETGDVETIEIGNRPAGIAFVDGLVWVSVQSPPSA
jgi:YVTN family beta-propeller protein